MILHYAGKYNGDENTLPQRKHQPNAVPFREVVNMKQLSLITNIGGILTTLILAVPFILLAKDIKDNKIWLALGGICAVLSIPIHELLHAIFFKKDVYYYNNLSQGLVFVIGTEDMSKIRFIFMCLCPNVFLGLVPYIIFLIYPNIVFLGVLGLTCIGMGVGDYVNVYNAIKQMPKESKTYLSGMHSYWYLEK